MEENESGSILCSSMRGFREVFSLTQTEASEFLGISQGKVSKLESGCQKPNFTLVQTLAEIGVDIEYFVKYYTF